MSSIVGLDVQTAPPSSLSAVTETTRFSLYRMFWFLVGPDGTYSIASINKGGRAGLRRRRPQLAK